MSSNDTTPRTSVQHLNPLRKSPPTGTVVGAEPESPSAMHRGLFSLSWPIPCAGLADVK